MRTGSNPNRRAPVTGFAPVVISATTHLPNLKGYHEQRMQVIKASLETMRANAGADCQILIWDNGSCDQLVNWLRRSYKPDYLVTSQNVGKSIARSSIVRMLPPETIIGCADDDIYYYPDWLKAHLEIYRVYPKIGSISGWPVRTQFRFHNKSTLEWAHRFAERYEIDHWISEQEDMDFCTSIGRDYNQHIAGTPFDQETRISYKGVFAYATGHHCQWIGNAGTLAPLVDFTRQAMADERPFEKAIDDAGLLRLTTYKRYTRHIGNILDKELEVEWQKIRQQ